MVDFTPSPISQFMTALYSNDFGTARLLLESNQIVGISYQAFMLIIQNGAASIIEITLRDPRVQAYVAYDSYEALRWTAAYGHVQAMEVLLRLPNVLEYVIRNNEVQNIANQNGRLEMAYRLSLVSQSRPAITHQYDTTNRQTLKRAIGQTEDPIFAVSHEEKVKHHRANNPNTLS